MKYLFFLISPLFIYAQTTMCFKNNWSDISTIEKQKFEGGECKGKRSIDEMKKDGWKIKDIKISTKGEKMDFIYILNLEELKEKQKVSNELDYNKVIEKIEESKEKKKNKTYLQEGKDLYVKICQTCHGEKGELKAKNTSRPLNTLSLETMAESIWAYRWDGYNRGRAFLMKPYLNFSTEVNLKKIKLYLDSINK